MKLVAEQQHYPFPYLYDESQNVAKAYEAACTPASLFMMVSCCWHIVASSMIPGRATTNRFQALISAMRWTI